MSEVRLKNAPPEVETEAESDPGGSLAAFFSSVGSVVPGVKAFQAKAAHALRPDVSEQDYAKWIDDLETHHPDATLLGQPVGVVAGAIASAPLLASLGLGAAGTAVVAGIEGLLSAGAHQIGDKVHQLQLDATPATIENVMQALDFTDMAESGVLSAVTGGLSRKFALSKLTYGPANKPGYLAQKATKLGEYAAEKVKKFAGKEGKAALGLATGHPVAGAVGYVFSDELDALGKATLDLGRKLADKTTRYIATHIDKFVQGTALGAAQFARKDLNTEYQEKQELLQSMNADPEGFATTLRHRLDGFPQPVADGIVAKSLEHSNLLAQAAPKNPMPPSLASGEWEPSDHAKREWLAIWDAVRDPINGFLYGTPQARAVAEQAHPETVKEFRRQLVDRLSTGNVPYTVKLKLARALGAAAVPSQDPLMGAKLQGIYQQQAAEGNQQSTEGRHSARQQRAMQVKDKVIKQWTTMSQNMMDVDKQ